MKQVQCKMCGLIRKAIVVLMAIVCLPPTSTGARSVCLGTDLPAPQGIHLRYSVLTTKHRLPQPFVDAYIEQIKNKRAAAADVPNNDLNVQAYDEEIKEWQARARAEQKEKTEAEYWASSKGFMWRVGRTVYLFDAQKCSNYVEPRTKDMGIYVSIRSGHDRKAYISMMPYLGFVQPYKDFYQPGAAGDVKKTPEGFERRSTLVLYNITDQDGKPASQGVVIRYDPLGRVASLRIGNAWITRELYEFEDYSKTRYGTAYPRVVRCTRQQGPAKSGLGPVLSETVVYEVNEAGIDPIPYEKLTMKRPPIGATVQDHRFVTAQHQYGVYYIFDGRYDLDQTSKLYADADRKRSGGTRLVAVAALRFACYLVLLIVLGRVFRGLMQEKKAQ